VFIMLQVATSSANAAVTLDAAYQYNQGYPGSQ
jgi:hypothetical protein